MVCGCDWIPRLGGAAARPFLLGLIGSLAAIAWPAVAAQAGGAAGQAVMAGDPSPVELVESWPVETTLDHPDIADAPAVWLEMIAGATRTLDFAEFYVSNAPDSLRTAHPEVAGRLEAVIEAIEAAAERGVRVRFLAEKKFYRTYPETLDRLDAHEGIEVTLFDVASVMGGVLHAKYFVIDRREAYLGSQNFDWRSLAHIQELGLRIHDPTLTGKLARVFDYDWALAHGEAIPHFPPLDTPLPEGYHCAFSPTGFLPDPGDWDLPRIVSLLDGAQRSIRVQLLSYKAIGRDHRYWNVLEDALRAAAARGVEVEMIVADWSKGGATIRGLQSLQCLEHITVKLATIPPWSGGFVPFARVIHAKYLVVDGARAWVGTSNWEKSYFHTSRNVGLVMEDKALAARLEAFFQSLWDSGYVETVQPGARYEKPRVAR